MYVLDRFEGENAIIEHGNEMIAVPRALLADGAKEGDVLIARNGFYAVDEAETARRAGHMRTRLNRLFNGDHL